MRVSGNRNAVDSDAVAGPDPVIEEYKKHVDRTLLRQNLALTPDERVRKLASFMESLQAVRGAARADRR
jgi:hypothetical protein